jgi:ubiquinone biosynthesis protein UbiJ
MLLANLLRSLRSAPAALLIGVLGACAATSTFAADGTIRQWQREGHEGF